MEIYKVTADTYDGRPCIRIEGKGEMPEGAFQSEEFPDEEWTAWYDEMPKGVA